MNFLPETTLGIITRNFFPCPSLQLALSTSHKLNVKPPKDLHPSMSLLSRFQKLLKLRKVFSAGTGSRSLTLQEEECKQQWVYLLERSLQEWCFILVNFPGVLYVCISTLFFSKIFPRGHFTCKDIRVETTWMQNRFWVVA